MWKKSKYWLIPKKKLQWSLSSVTFSPEGKHAESQKAPLKVLPTKTYTSACSTSPTFNQIRFIGPHASVLKSDTLIMNIFCCSVPFNESLYCKHLGYANKITNLIIQSNLNYCFMNVWWTRLDRLLSECNRLPSTCLKM